jgi:glycosyltransferase involved in cell wall biosynthesis
LKIVTVSDFSRRELATHLGVPGDQVTVVPESGEHILDCPSDPSILARHGLQGKPFVLAVGSVNQNKNLRAVLTAFERAKKKDYELVVAGGFNDRVFGRPTLRFPPATTYLGRVNDRELRALYEAARCLVYPSLYEGFGLPPLEAMTCGCPVVAADATSLPEVCGDAAVYCDPRDPEDIIAKIERVMTDDGLRNALGQRGRARAEAFTWERAARELWSAIVTAPGNRTDNSGKVR